MDLYDIELHGCTVKSVRADMVKGRVAITFETNLDEEMQRVRRNLSFLSVGEAPVDLTIREQYPQLPLKVNIAGSMATALEDTDESDNEPDPH